MSGTAVVLGGTGLVGSAAVLALAESGWDVGCTGRTSQRFSPELARHGVRFHRSDRHERDELAEVLGEGADVVVDCAGYTGAHAQLLVDHRERIGSIVFISTKAVYVDAVGRHSNSDDPPHFDRPVRETQPTLTPSDRPYQSREGYGANKVAAELVLLECGTPVSIVRPSRVHGRGAARPREWVFVKRVLDNRRDVLLAHRGAGTNHPTAAANLAALVRVCAERPGTRIVNSADPDAPSGLDIARTVAARLNHDWAEHLLDETAPAALGDHPWNTVPPFVLDTTAAEQLGYRPVGTYGETVAAELDWLARSARDDVLPVAEDDEYFRAFFDYEAEDEWLHRSS